MLSNEIFIGACSYEQVDDDHLTCSECLGDGMIDGVHDFDVPCEKCEGKGYIDSEKE